MNTTIPTNLTKSESGTKSSLKKWDFWPESGILIRNLAKIAKITKFIRKKVHKKVCKGVATSLRSRIAQSSVQDVAKMCANVHKLYTPSMTTLDTLLGN